MDRIAQIEYFATQEVAQSVHGLVYAMVRCLDPDDAVKLLLRSVSTSTPVRTAAIRKVCAHITSGKLIDPAPLVAMFTAQIENGEPRRRESVAYCLLEIARACSPPLQRQVQAFFSASRYVGLRRRGYKLYDAESEESRVLLERAWREYEDSGATWWIVKTFPVLFLVAEKDALLNTLTEGWQLSRLYLRMAESAPEILEELLELDSISYIYVTAKRGIPPPVEIVERVLDCSLGDDRLGLLLWSIGELGLWDVLVGVTQRLEAVEAAQHLRFLKQLPPSV